MTNGTLKDNEYHPAADSAIRYLKSLGFEKLMLYQEVFSSCALSGNRMEEICSETLRRILTKESASDRYLLGLAWEIRDMEEKE